jgi:hypothetical protein
MSSLRQNQALFHMHQDLDHNGGQLERKFAMKLTPYHKLLPNPLDAPHTFHFNYPRWVTISNNTTL